MYASIMLCLVGFSNSMPEPLSTSHDRHCPVGHVPQLVFCAFRLVSLSTSTQAHAKRYYAAERLEAIITPSVEPAEVGLVAGQIQDVYNFSKILKCRF